jgi:Tol biopolymer transport system component
MLTDSSAAEYWPSIDVKGLNLAFTSTSQRPPRISLKDLRTGKESELPSIGLPAEYPKISPDGKRIAYTVVRQNSAALYIAPVGSAQPEKVSMDCDWAWGWSPDGKYLLCKVGIQRRVRLLEISSGTASELLEDPDGQVFQASFSPDGRWITFLCSGHLYIAAFRGPGSIEKQHWITVANSGHFDDKPRFSPDGNLLYFISDRDGQPCLWAQRLDVYAKTPQDDPWPVYHLHAARRSLLNVGAAFLDFAVAPHSLILPLDELSGNVWMIERTHQVQPRTASQQ